MKRCSKCGEEKELGDFHRDRRSKDGHVPDCKVCRLAATNAYAAANREKCNERVADWQRRNPERVNAKSRRWQEENREQYLECKRSYYDANRERLLEENRLYRLANREAILQRQREQYNPDKKRLSRDPVKSKADYDRRRALLLNAYVEDVDFDVLLQRDEGCCGICGLAIMEATIEVDHVIPLSQGGEHSYANVQLAHRSCNRRKCNSLSYKAA